MNGEKPQHVIGNEEGSAGRNIVLAGSAALLAGFLSPFVANAVFQRGMEGVDESLETTQELHIIQSPESDENEIAIPTPPEKSSTPSTSPSTIEIIVPSLSPTPSATATEAPTPEVEESPSTTTEQPQTPQPLIESKPRTVWEQTYAVSPETAEVESALLHIAETTVNWLVASKTDRVVGEGGVLKNADIKSESYDKLDKKAIQLVASDATLSLAVSDGSLELGYFNAAGEQASVAFVSEAGTAPPSDRAALKEWLKQSSITNVRSMVPQLVDPTIVERLDDKNGKLNPMNAPGTFKGASFIVDQDGNWQESAMDLSPGQSLLGATTEETIVAAGNSINEMIPGISAAEKLIEKGIK